MNQKKLFDLGLDLRVLEGAPMGIIFCDKMGVIRYMNHACQKDLDPHDIDACDMHISEVLPQLCESEFLVQEDKFKDLYLSIADRRFIVKRHLYRGLSGSLEGLLIYLISYDGNALQPYSSRIRELEQLSEESKIKLTWATFAQFEIKDLIGESPQIRKVIHLAEKFSALDDPVLIRGDAGAEVEPLAHAIHAASRRAQGPLIVVKCSLLLSQKFEAALFGSETSIANEGSVWVQPGKIELADNGTIYLDEITDLPLAHQARLLRALESHSLTRNGGRRALPINIRLIASTRRDLERLLKAGLFREDLYYRIRNLTLNLPPLRERPEDILIYARYILERLGFASLKFSRKTEEEMLRYCWPANASQLYDAVARAAAKCNGAEIEPEDFPEDALCSNCLGCISQTCLAKVSAAAETQAIRRALSLVNYNVTSAAKKLRISRATLYEKLRKYGIDTRRN